MNKFSGSKIFLTGGCGTLGKAIVNRSIEERWDCEFTIYNRDPMKQHVLKSMFPEANLRFVLGNVEDYNSLSLAIAGHDVVLHLGAMKHIPEGERDPITMYQTNVGGTLNVAEACGVHDVKQAVFISTDKVCYPVNAYGATKKMGEYIFQKYSDYYPTKYNVVRYGNVLGSTGSVIQVWKNMLENEGKVRATDPHMTRFWLTDDMAVHLILSAIDLSVSGTILVPLLKTLSMKKMAEYVLGDVPIEYMGLRPGEKRHECMITSEEFNFTRSFGDPKKVFEGFQEIYPSTHEPINDGDWEPYTSERGSGELSREELLSMIGVE